MNHSKRKTKLSSIEPKKEEAPQIQIASETVKTQLASISLENTELKNTLKFVTDERDALKQQNIELASVIENQLRADKIVRIQAASKYTASDLETKTVEELQSIEETLTHAQGYESNIYKSIRCGNASTQPSRLTVGSPYGLTPEETAKWQRGEL